MKAQKTTLLLLFAFALISVMSLASATVAVVSPVTGANITGTTTFNCSYNSTNFVNPLNATFYYNLSGGRVVVGNVVNTTGFQNGSISGQLSTSALTDGIYSISCTITNSSDSVNSSTSTTIVLFDNTAPTVSTALTYGDLYDLNDKVPYTVTASDLRSITYAVSLIDTSNNRYLQNFTNASASFSKGLDVAGSYKIQTVVTNAVGLTTTVNKYITVKASSALVKAKTEVATNQAQSLIERISNNKVAVTAVIIVVILLFVVILFIVAKDKKK